MIFKIKNVEFIGCITAFKDAPHIISFPLTICNWGKDLTIGFFIWQLNINWEKIE